MSNYTFITKSTQPDTPFLVTPSTTSFYQISLYPNPSTKLHHIRKFKIDGNDNITSVSNHYLKKSQYEQLIKNKKPNTYKQYSVFDLKQTNYPNKGDILMLKSNILSSPSNYTGYAPFMSQSLNYSQNADSFPTPY